jgi:hypothetical protein
VQTIDGLRKSFDERSWCSAFDAMPVMRDRGLVGLLGRTQIRVHYTPYKEGTDEEYPDPED